MAHPDDRMPEKNNVDVLVRRLALQDNTVRPHSVGLRVARSRANRRQVVCHLTAVKFAGGECAPQSSTFSDVAFAATGLTGLPTPRRPVLARDSHSACRGDSPRGAP